jgi:hypothetical protein
MRIPKAYAAAAVVELAAVAFGARGLQWVAKPALGAAGVEPPAADLLVMGAYISALLLMTTGWVEANE